MNRLLAVLFALALAVSTSARAATPEVKPGKVDGATALSLATAGARVVDVRTPQEFASGHVPGALNIPVDEIEKRAAEIGPTSTRVVLYCRSGRRSARRRRHPRQARLQAGVRLRPVLRVARRREGRAGQALSRAGAPGRPRPRRA